MNAIAITTKIAVIAAALVILSAGILGYTALFDLFVSIGLFSAWLGVFFPLLFDLAEITAAVAVFNAKLQGEDDKFAWGMVLLFTILGIIANLGHATYAWHIGKISPAQLALAVFCTSVFPLSVALVTHLVKRVLARDIARRGLVSSLEELAGQMKTATANLEKLHGQIEAARTQLSDLKAGQIGENSRSVQELQAARQAKIEERRTSVLSLLGEGLTEKDIAGELGVTVKTIRRDIQALNGQVTK